MLMQDVMLIDELSMLMYVYEMTCESYVSTASALACSPLTKVVSAVIDVMGPVHEHNVTPSFEGGSLRDALEDEAARVAELILDDRRVVPRDVAKICDDLAHARLTIRAADPLRDHVSNTLSGHVHTSLMGEVACYLRYISFGLNHHVQLTKSSSSAISSPRPYLRNASRVT